MGERKTLVILTVIQALQCADAMFFHESSSIALYGVGATNNTDFGFGMSFMNGKDNNILVVGAPKADNEGMVYTCEISLNIQEACEASYINKPDYDNDGFPNQNFFMGSSIVATSEYFFTCAPLWTTTINAIRDRQKITIEDAFGTCFIKYIPETQSYSYHGLLERYQNMTISQRSSFQVDRFTGGTGWTTLMDEENKLLLIAKTSLDGDFLYLNSSHPDYKVKSLLDDTMQQKSYSRYFKEHYNIGFGVTGGKFFSQETVYAYSMLQKNMQGSIGFLAYRHRKLSVMCKGKGTFSRNMVLELKNDDVGVMFGTTLSAADLNADGLDELMVSAPVESQDECFECGALHIYIGGDMNTIQEPKRLRSIYASTHFGRFGTAVAAKDIDGDGKPDLVVSAPYENEGRGAIYILSGHEVFHTLMKYQDYKNIQLSDLKMTQRIQKESQKTLGFSLQFLTDTDENGCSELAAGSPGTSQVLILKCVQKINVRLSSQLMGEQIVREQDTSFTVQVCARVQIPDLPTDIVGNLTIETSIIGEAAVVLQPNITVDISCFSCPRDRKDICENVTVELKDNEPGRYTLYFNAKLQNNYLMDKNMTEFNETWVEVSPNSRLDTSLLVTRHCKGNDCLANLTMDILWSGSSDSYLLGSSTNETATIKVKNHGNASYTACVRVRVSGAPPTVGCRPYDGGFTCDRHLQYPLKRTAEESIALMLDMTKPTNVAENLTVEVKLYENCNQKTIIKSNKTLIVPYKLTSDNVFNDGHFHKLNITDKQILDKAIIYDHHEYVIRNNGSITWENVTLDLGLEMRPYIKSFDILETNFLECKENFQTISNHIIRHCTLKKLPPNSTQTIVGTIEITAGDLGGITKESGMNVTSTSKLFLTRAPTINATYVTEITIQKELTIGSNKLMIGLIAAFLALVLLAILTFILYKCGFFKRKQQKKLLVMQESIRRKSVRRNTHASAMDGPMEGLQIEVDDDSPFDEARPVTSSDDVGLVDKDEA